jgi:hypothetical protein
MNLDSETMKVAVSKAILDNLGPEGQTLVLQQAVASLLEPDDSKSYSYGRDHPTKIQAMFQKQAGVVAMQVVREKLQESDEFKEQIHGLVREATEALFKSDLLHEKLAAAVVEVIGNMRISS